MPAARTKVKPAPELPVEERPSIGLPDPLEAAQEEARHAKEGALKLSRAIDAMRGALETIVVAEVDLKTNLPVTAVQLRSLAVEGLNEYSRISGQSWRRHKLIGSWAGDRRLDNLEG